MEPNDLKRLFFALELKAAWPDALPQGRVLKEEARHVTLAFLGNQSLSKLLQDVSDLPWKEPFLGFAGWCNKVHFLPKRHPRVVAGHVVWSHFEALIEVQKTLAVWLEQHGYPVDERPFHPHLTLARSPFRFNDWRKALHSFPVIAYSLNLYESVGNLCYEPVWKFPLISPIEEIEHTADMAFRIRGKAFKEIFLNALIALSFKSPALLHYGVDLEGFENLDDVIMRLNGVVAHADADQGCPFKAVSYHGEAIQESEGVLVWEMIVDV
jgi:2'-5' RNA ligase